jgi:hypothetical protein
MNRKRLRTSLAVLTVLISSIAVAAPASAQNENPNTYAVDFCRGLEEEGLLDALGITFGECVNIFAGLETQNINRAIAGFCGIDFFQAIFGNKGQCVSFLQQNDFVIASG